MNWSQDTELVDWLINAADRAGDFVKLIAMAAMHADALNYPLLRPLLLTLKEKYPAYGETGESDGRRD